MHYTVLFHPEKPTAFVHERLITQLLGLLERPDSTLHQVFFYGPVVGSVADPSIASLWATLQTNSPATELALCSGAAEQYQLDEPPPPFVIAGLGAFIEAALTTHKVLDIA